MNFDIIDLNKASGVILQQVLCKGCVLLNKQTRIYSELIKKICIFKEEE